MPITASYITATIANAGTTSTEVDVAGTHNVSLWLPAAWTAATLTIQVQREGSAQWCTVCDGVGPVVLPAAADRALLLPGGTVLPNGARKLRLVSSVAQGAERIIGVEQRSF